MRFPINYPVGRAYKIVSTIGKKFYSANLSYNDSLSLSRGDLLSCIREGNEIVEYNIGQITCPKEPSGRYNPMNALFAWKTLKEAKKNLHIYNYGSGAGIMLGYAGNPMEINNEDDENKAYKRYGCNFTVLPTKYVLCDWFLPISLVKL